MYQENKYQNESCEVNREELTYESQIQQLLNISDRLKSKVFHITAEGLKGQTEVPRISHSTKLNRDLEEVIYRFEAIIDSIQN
jgi:hypothetical protein